ncbi:MAG: LLM class F420-dependent oxidoreductase [Acidimicrobiia bacterium]|nr:LLM class F420-dependent oxidoreductase [Acidimicrobiia bacterium]
MRLATTIQFTGDPAKLTRRVQDLESAGIDMVWTGEIYGYDSVSVFGYLMGQTTRMQFMTGILPIYSRTPALLAMTAMTLDALSGGRFHLGIGTSGPQVIEGWHGVPFDKPIQATREIIDVCRQVWRRERLEYDGKAIQLPLPAERGTGLGKPLKLMNTPLRADIPIWVASLGPKNVEITFEAANGWQPIHFVPDRFRQVWGDAIDAGLAKRDPALGPVEIIAGGSVALGDGPEVREAREAVRQNTGFYVGGMGAKGKNFYNDLFKRYGYEQEAEQIQDLFLSGHRDEAYSKVPDEYLDMATLCGDEGHVRERIAVYKEIGTTWLQVNPVGENPLEIIEKVRAWAE